MGPQGGGGASLAVPLTRPKDVGILHFAPGLVQCLEGGGSQNIFIQWMDGVDWEKAQGQGWGMKSWRWKAASHRFGQIWALWTRFLCSLLHGPAWLERPRSSSSQGFSWPNVAHCTYCIMPFQRPLLAPSPSGQIPPVSPPALSPASALCVSGCPASSLMFLLIGWLRAYENVSLLLLSRPHHPPRSQNTHTTLLSSFPINQPSLDILKGSFSELVVLIPGFWKILLGPGFTSWPDGTDFPSVAQRCWLPNPSGLSDLLSRLRNARW